MSSHRFSGAPTGLPGALLRSRGNGRGIPATAFSGEGDGITLAGREPPGRSAALLIASAMGVLLAMSAATAPASAERADIVIEGGKIVDGSGSLPYAGDVAILGDEIVYVGPRYPGEARETVDASGMVVAPGFIDAHNHTDRFLGDVDKGANEAFVRQGVTTIVGGPDGFASPAMIREYVGAYEAAGIGTNVAFYVGHNAIRREVVGTDHRAATPAEIRRMQALVREGMDLGAVGFSTGLMYEPGMWADTEEVVALAQEVAPYGGIYDSHVRNPVFELLQSDVEAIEIGRRAGVAVKIAHEKVVGLHNEGLLGKVVSLVNGARSRGENVVVDQYPYDGAATAFLHDLILLPDRMAAELEAFVDEVPERAGEAKIAFLRDRLHDGSDLAEMRTLSEEGRDGGFSWIKAVGYTSIRIVHSEDFPDLEGTHLSELAARQGVSGFEALVDLVRRAEHPVLATLGSVAEADVQALMIQPWTMIASDGSWIDRSGRAAGGHPRSTGTFPRVLGRYVRELGLLDLPTAVYKMSRFPAEFLNLPDRGALEEGRKADVVVFDENTIADRSTWADPSALAVGVRDVMVNGEWVLRNAEMTGKRPGRFVRRQARDVRD